MKTSRLFPSLNNPGIEISIIGEITKDTFRYVLERVPNSFTGNLVLHLCSEGGDYGAGIAIYDYIQILNLKDSKVYIWGECASTATVIIQAFKTRIAAKSTQFFFHDGFFTEKNFQDRFGKKMNQLAQVPTKCRIGEENYKLCRKEALLTAERALALGVIDNILGKTIETSSAVG